MPQFQRYDDHGLAAGGLAAAGGVASSEDSPPSYSEAMRTPGPADQAQTSIWTTPIGQPKLPTRLSRNQMQLEVDSHPEPLGAMARLSPTGLATSSMAAIGFSSVSESGNTFNSFHRTNSLESQGVKKEFRNWNPPMLGNLPDDFLRLKDSNSGFSGAKLDIDRTENLSTTPVNVMSLTDARPKVHKSRSKSEKVSRSVSMGTKEGKEKSRGSDRKSKSSDKMSRSFSLVDGSQKSGVRHKDIHTEVSPTRSRNHAVVGIKKMLTYLSREN